MDKHMSHDLFNRGGRIFATTEHQNLKSSNQKVTKHYIDLQFCVSKTFFLFAVIKVYMISHKNVFSLSDNI
jgi:macrodomain Ter protein organizer (MatP/YcbG family)